MVRYEQFVYEPEIIIAILDICEVAYVGFQDRNNAYVVPLIYGYEATKDQLLIFLHTGKEGYTQKLLRKNPRVCCTFAAWRNFPERPYKGHIHDYRSVMAFGRIRLIDQKAEADFCRDAMQALFRKTNRTECRNPGGMPATNMYVIECNWEDVSGKTETPVRSPDDVPFVDVYSVPEDQNPYDQSDLRLTRKNEIRNKNYLGFLDN